MEITPLRASIRLSEQHELREDVEVIVGLNQQKGLSFPNVVLRIQRGRYRMTFPLGFLYDRDPNIHTLSAEITIEENYQSGHMMFFVVIGEEWRDFAKASVAGMSPHRSENIDYYIGRKPATPAAEVDEEDEKDETTYKLVVGHAELNIVLDFEVFQFYRHNLNRVKEQILGNAIVWACYNAHGRQIHTIRAKVVDQIMGTLGIEYHFMGIDEGLPEFDKLTVLT